MIKFCSKISIKLIILIVWNFVCQKMYMEKNMEVNFGFTRISCQINRPRTTFNQLFSVINQKPYVLEFTVTTELHTVTRNDQFFGTN